jgi:type IV secretion system protein VirD4
LLIGVGCGIALRLVGYFKVKEFQHGKEYGFSRWGTAKDIKPYINLVFENNVLLTEVKVVPLGADSARHF